MDIFCMSWKILTGGSAGVTLAMAAVQPSAVSIAASVVCAGSVIVPQIVSWYQKLKEEARNQHIKDVETDSAILHAEVVRRTQLEAHAKELESLILELKHQRCPFADQDGAACRQGDQPEWKGVVDDDGGVDRVSRENQRRNPAPPEATTGSH